MVVSAIVPREVHHSLQTVHAFQSQTRRSLTMVGDRIVQYGNQICRCCCFVDMQLLIVPIVLALILILLVLFVLIWSLLTPAGHLSLLVGLHASSPLCGIILFVCRFLQ